MDDDVIVSILTLVDPAAGWIVSGVSVGASGTVTIDVSLDPECDEDASLRVEVCGIALPLIQLEVRYPLRSCGIRFGCNCHRI